MTVNICEDLRRAGGGAASRGPVNFVNFDAYSGFGAAHTLSNPASLGLSSSASGAS